MTLRKHMVRPDSPDFRDRMYSPTLKALKSEYNAEPFRDERWVERVKDQGTTSACTGFALSSMVEVLHELAQRPHSVQVSPYMLYYLARRYDEIPGADQDEGSTARGAMKAWHKHGACQNHLWDNIGLNLRNVDDNWEADAFQRPLGAYYRVDHTSISDMHAAINESQVLYATAQIHEGWDNLEGLLPISYSGEEAILGGHAFLIVGYDATGFIIQNSWSKNWGVAGFARLSYGDWRANGMDAWVAQLGVNISRHAETVGRGLCMKTARVKSGGIDSKRLLSTNPVVSAQQINPYIINLGNNGELSATGQFYTYEEDLVALATTHLENAIADFELGKDDPIDVAIYAHGGLVPEKGAADTARAWIPEMYARKIFPVFMMWESGFLDTLSYIVKERLGLEVPGATAAGFWEKMEDFMDDRMESLLSGLGTAMWDEMKENARLASENPQGALQMLYEILCNKTPANIRRRLRLHLIGHSCGAIFHCHLLPLLMKAKENKFSVDSVSFMAPACRSELFNSNIRPYLATPNNQSSSLVREYNQFFLCDSLEQKDNCHPLPYNRSLLYLVSNSFERGRGTPLAGMEKFLDLIQGVDGDSYGNWFKAQTGDTGNVLTMTNSTSHGGFDNDIDTRNAVLGRINPH
jgi:hypothetical protein